MSYDDYDRYDAMADEAAEREAELIRPRLDALVQPIMDRVEEMDEEADYPHPWTWERSLLQILLDEGSDALREELEEHFYDEAKEQAQEDAREEGPCCNSFYCPCGNSNMDRRF